jgi:thiol-disulfide isomerase/thioredoxin
MVLYYADWCGHCTTMKPEWQKVVNKMKQSNIVNVAEVESTHIADLVNKPEVNGFPSIKMYNSGTETANFEDERIADKMEKFAMSNTTKSIKTNTSKSLIKKKSNGYINPMKQVINSLSRKKRTMKKTMKNMPMHMPMPMPMPMPMHTPTHHKKPTHHKMPIYHKKPTHHKMPIYHKKPTQHKVKSHKSHKSHKSYKSHKSHKSHKVSKSKSVKSNANLRNSTKNVYTQLIKSFNRIGKEAKQDSILLKQATHLI